MSRENESKISNGSSRTTAADRLAGSDKKRSQTDRSDRQPGTGFRERQVMRDKHERLHTERERERERERDKAGESGVTCNVLKLAGDKV